MQHSTCSSKMRCLAGVWILCLSATTVIGARILALIPFSGKSHYINIQPIMQQLAERGHEVTVVTTNFEKNPPPNYRQIICDQRSFWDAFGSNLDRFAFENMVFPKEMKLLWDAAYFSTEVAFNSTTLQEFIRDDKTEFDLIFIELFYQEALYMFAHKYNAPIVAISTMGFTQYLGDSIGNPLLMSYMPHEFLPTKNKLSLWKRIENTFYTTYDLMGRKFYTIPKHQRLAERHFSALPGPLPKIADLERTVSVILVNTHYSIDVVRPYVPGVIEIGGAHIKPRGELEPDVQKFINEAEHGVVFFSMGSNIKSNEMPKKKMEMFLRVFSRLKQRVLWKWEDDKLPGQPKNVMTKKWLAQTDVLGNSNVRAFITHGGLLSFIEAVHFGVPVVGIPVYGDQHLNTAKAENLGMGVKLLFSSMTEKSLTAALDKVLNEPSYKRTAEDLSRRFRDRPKSPMDSAIYWIEFVINHKGAMFLRSPMLDLEWYEYYMVDAGLIFAAVLASALVVTVIGIKMTLFVLCKFLCRKKQAKSEKKNK